MSVGRPHRRSAAYPWRGCRGKAGHLPRRPVHGERGNHLGIALPAVQPGRWRAGPSSTDEPEMGRSPRSSPRSGKPATWRRRAANLQGVVWNARRSPVNTDAPSPTLIEAEARVLGIQHTLQRRTAPDVWRMGSWRAGCGESRTSGSEGGPEKPTDRKVDRALWPDPYCCCSAARRRGCARGSARRARPEFVWRTGPVSEGWWRAWWQKAAQLTSAWFGRTMDGDVLEGATWPKVTSSASPIR
jgi:hypothetical protein